MTESSRPFSMSSKTKGAGKVKQKGNDKPITSSNDKYDHESSTFSFAVRGPIETAQPKGSAMNKLNLLSANTNFNKLSLLEKGVKCTIDNVLKTYLVISDNICLLVIMRY